MRATSVGEQRVWVVGGHPSAEPKCLHPQSDERDATRSGSVLPRYWYSHERVVFPHYWYSHAICKPRKFCVHCDAGHHPSKFFRVYNLLPPDLTPWEQSTMITIKSNRTPAPTPPPTPPPTNDTWTSPAPDDNGTTPAPDDEGTTPTPTSDEGTTVAAGGGSLLQQKLLNDTSDDAKDKLAAAAGDAEPLNVNKTNSTTWPDNSPPGDAGPGGRYEVDVKVQIPLTLDVSNWTESQRYEAGVAIISGVHTAACKVVRGLFGGDTEKCLRGEDVKSVENATAKAANDTEEDANPPSEEETAKVITNVIDARKVSDALIRTGRPEPHYPYGQKPGMIRKKKEEEKEVESGFTMEQSVEWSLPRDELKELLTTLDQRYVFWNVITKGIHEAFCSAIGGHFESVQECLRGMSGHADVKGCVPISVALDKEDFSRGLPTPAYPYAESPASIKRKIGMYAASHPDEKPRPVATPGKEEGNASAEGNATEEEEAAGETEAPTEAPVEGNATEEEAGAENEKNETELPEEGNATEGNATEENATEEEEEGASGNATDENATEEEEEAAAGNATEENATEENATEENATEQENATEENATEQNATEENATEENATEQNATEGNATEGNATEQNATEGNATEENATTAPITATKNTTEDAAELAANGSASANATDADKNATANDTKEGNETDDDHNASNAPENDVGSLMSVQLYEDDGDEMDEGSSFLERARKEPTEAPTKPAGVSSTKGDMIADAKCSAFAPKYAGAKYMIKEFQQNLDAELVMKKVGSIMCTRRIRGEPHPRVNVSACQPSNYFSFIRCS